MNGIETAIFDIAKALRVPVLVLALAAVALTLLELGAFAVELLRRRRRDFINLDSAASEARAALDRGDEPGAKSALRPVAWSTQMARTLAFLVDQWGKPQLADRMAKGLADFDFRSVRRLDRTRLLVRAGPALGLMGTLIPLSPALSGLAKGDVKQLQDNLQIAFSVTVLGLLVGAVAFGISLVRDRVYGQDLSDLEFVMTTLLPEDDVAVAGAARPASDATAHPGGGTAAASTPAPGGAPPRPSSAAASGAKPPPPAGAKPLGATLPPPTGVAASGAAAEASGAAGPGVASPASSAARDPGAAPAAGSADVPVPDPSAPAVPATPAAGIPSAPPVPSAPAAPPTPAARPVPEATPDPAAPDRDATRQQAMPPTPASDPEPPQGDPIAPGAPSGPGEATDRESSSAEPATQQLPPSPTPDRKRDNNHPNTPEGTTTDEPW
jgi:biopolymer transport protein ExbB/TolQ